MKIIVAIVLFAAFAAGALALMRRIYSGRGLSAGGSDARAAEEGQSTQDTLPVADVRGPVLLQRDGTAIAYVKVRCRNNSLLNLKELTADAAAIAPSLAAQTKAFKILHMQNPADSSANLALLESVDEGYLRQLSSLDGGGGRHEAMLRRQTLARREALGHYKRHAELEVRQSDKMQSEAYVVLPVPFATGNEELAYRQACDMRDRLKAAGYASHVLWGEEIVALGLAYQGAHRTRGERTSPDYASPLVRGIHDASKEGSYEA